MASIEEMYPDLFKTQTNSAGKLSYGKRGFSPAYMKPTSFWDNLLSSLMSGDGERKIDSNKAEMFQRGFKEKTPMAFWEK